ncbi:hypothetical protein XACN24_11740 [Xanthomonas albilineans]|uniref:hypothetical protein n=1 Tax=Xanthomonas albilineans TaxID=29447 RepID=UPI000A4EA41A|nr:hypothetical protein [Xanthomonas albilineans]
MDLLRLNGQQLLLISWAEVLLECLLVQVQQLRSVQGLELGLRLWVMGFITRLDPAAKKPKAGTMIFCMVRHWERWLH